MLSTGQTSPTTPTLPAVPFPMRPSSPLNACLATLVVPVPAILSMLLHRQFPSHSTLPRAFHASAIVPSLPMSVARCLNLNSNPLPRTPIPLRPTSIMWPASDLPRHRTRRHAATVIRACGRAAPGPTRREPVVKTMISALRLCHSPTVLRHPLDRTCGRALQA